METPERILKFDIKGQRIIKKPSCDFSHIVAGSEGYLKAKFYFSQKEWKSCMKAASFWVNDKETGVLLDERDTCLIPKEVLSNRTFKISVTGIRPGYKISTNRVKVTQEVK